MALPRAVLVSAAALLLLVGLLVSPAVASPGAVIDAVNAERAQQGLGPLAGYGDDSMAARANDDYAASEVAHRLADDASSWYFSRGATSWAENQAIVSSSQASGSRVAGLWRDSPGHARNMFDEDATHIAVAVTSSGGQTYYTAHIVSDGSGPVPLPSEPEGGNDGGSGGGSDEGGDSSSGSGSSGSSGSGSSGSSAGDPADRGSGGSGGGGTDEGSSEGSGGDGSAAGDDAEEPHGDETEEARIALTVDDLISELIDRFPGWLARVQAQEYTNPRILRAAEDGSRNLSHSAGARVGLPTVTATVSSGLQG